MVLNKQQLTSALIFCDGACSGNPGPGGWGAVVVTPDGQVQELGGAVNPTTNNRMELAAAIFSLKYIEDVNAEVSLYTDSVYVIRGITQWIWGWRRRAWKTAEGEDVANRDQWQELASIVERRPKNASVDWRYVRGHSGVAGNERVDEIAVSFSKSYPSNLYSGSLVQYGVPIFDLPESHEVPESKNSSTTKKAAAYSYLSVVDGVPMRHKTWPECEKRVSGRSGARFKKALSEADEIQILASWGVKL